MIIYPLTKENIEALPVFPAYETFKEVLETGETEVTLMSGIYVHKDVLLKVEVYKRPIITTFKKKFRKADYQKQVDTHLKQCLVVSKYGDITPKLLNTLPLIDTIEKYSTDFDYKLFNLYP